MFIHISQALKQKQKNLFHFRILIKIPSGRTEFSWPGQVKSYNTISILFSSNLTTPKAFAFLPGIQNEVPFEDNEIKGRKRRTKSLGLRSECYFVVFVRWTGTRKGSGPNHLHFTREEEIPICRNLHFIALFLPSNFNFKNAHSSPRPASSGLKGA